MSSTRPPRTWVPRLSSTRYRPGGTSWIEKAPPGVRAALNYGTACLERDKGVAITAITANKQNPFTPEQLAAKDLPELQPLAAFAQPVTEENPGPTPANFGGQATPV